MGLTRLQLDQVDRPSTYNDALTAANYASGVTVEDELNYIRSQLKTVLGTDFGAWYTAPPVGETVSDLFARESFENKTMLRRVQILTDVVVGAGVSYVVLSSAINTPAVPLAWGATTIGAVVAKLAGAVGSFALTEIAGVNALNPKNLIRIVDGSTGNSIMSGASPNDREVFALLQCSSTTLDGDLANDANTPADMVQLSFVIANSTNDDLIQCPTGDIAGKTINYMYVERIKMVNALEQDFDSSFMFTDQAGSVNVTLQNAVTNQSGNVAVGAKNIVVELNDNYKWQYTDGTNNILDINGAPVGVDNSITIGASGTQTNLIVYGTTDLTDTLTVDSLGQPIYVGSVAGQIGSSSLTLATTAGNLGLSSFGELQFTDSRISSIEFTDATYNTLPGGATSIVGAINLAYNAVASGTSRADANTTGIVSANTLITNPTNLSAVLVNYAKVDDATTAAWFVSNVLVWINGVYQRPGVDAAANNDVYPATFAGGSATGSFYCEKSIKNNSNIMMMIIP